MTISRCHWVTDDPLYIAYHDNEWGVPCHDDRKLFEFLILEGAQAGLSWLTILKRREGYRQAFAGFDPAKVADFSDEYLEALLEDTSIIRNRRKVFSARHNARAFLEVQKEFGSFAAFAWAFVGDKPIVNHWPDSASVPATSAESDALSKALKKRGFSFVGSTICYAWMQAMGLVNDHEANCICRASDK